MEYQYFLENGREICPASIYSNKFFEVGRTFCALDFDDEEAYYRVKVIKVDGNKIICEIKE